MADPLGSVTEAATNELALIVGIGVGLAVQSALAPAATDIAQATYNVNPGKAVDANTVAAIVAEDVEKLPWGESEAQLTGINNERFQEILGEALNGPGFGELIRMIRRDTIDSDTFTHGLRKAKLETLWDQAMADLQHERLSVEALATGVQRSLVPNPGILPVTFDNTGSNVTPMPVADIDVLAEALAQGYDTERFSVLARTVGLPPAPGELMQLLNRQTINEAAFNQGIAEGNTRNEWASVLMTLKRRLLTPHEYEEANLRGVLEPDAAHAGAALSGMEQADAELLFEIMGRSLAVHQITTGLARGGTYGGTYDDVPEPYRDAIRRSSVRPEYAVLDYANRYTVPSYFILKAILSDGGMTPAQFAQYGKELGWPPDLADSAAKALSTGTAAKGDPYVTKANTQLWNTIHTAYVDSRADDQLATSTFDSLGVTAGAQPVVLDLWKQERDIHRSGLTAAQIKKTVGLPGWTDAERMTRLADLGFSTEDATTFLAE